MSPLDSGKRTSDNHKTVLVVEDDSTTLEVTCALLKHLGFAPLPCRAVEEAEQLLRDHAQIDAAVIDLGLPDGDGIDIIRLAHRIHPQFPCFVLTSSETVDSAVMAMKAGAADYFTKPLDPEVLITCLDGAIDMYRRERGIMAAPSRAVVRQWKSPRMQQVYQQALDVAKTHSPVLITGQPDTGKKSIARMIHAASDFGKKDFLTINAAVTPSVQIESRLFGKPLIEINLKAGLAIGLLEKNRGATVYIENIENLTATTQSLLAEWLNGDRGDIAGKPPAARLIASSTAQSLQAAEQIGLQRDLWFALTVDQIDVPSLSERVEDIPMLCEEIITSICVSHRLRRPSLSKKALECLLDYSWPGNFSELRSVLEHAVNHTTDRLIGPDDLPRLQSGGAVGVTLPLGVSSIDDITKATLVATLDSCDGNRRRAAQRLKVSLRTVYNMIQRYGLMDTTPRRKRKPL